MKAEFTEDGFIKITTESIVESIAMGALIDKASEAGCARCGQIFYPVLFDWSMPDKKNKNEVAND